MKIPQPRKLPSGAWNVQLMISGERVSITRPTKKEAEQEAMFQKSAAATGKRQQPQRSSEKTVGDLVDAYINSRSNVISPTTLEGYRVIRRNRFSDVMDKPFSSVESWQAVVNDEAAKVSKRKNEKVSPKTLHNAWNLLQSAFEAAHLTVDERITLPAKSMREHPFLLPEQIEPFLHAIYGQDCEMGALLGLHSLRRSESINLKRRDVDLDRGIIHVSGSTVVVTGAKIEREQNKTKDSTRVVPIVSKRLRALISEIEDPDAPLVTIAPMTLYKQINRICAAAGLPLIGTHGLRHSFCALSYKVGLPEWATMRIGGWSSPDVVHKHYAHFQALDAECYGENLEAFFSKIQPL